MKTRIIESVIYLCILSLIPFGVSAQDGSLDLNFSSDGKVLTNVGSESDRPYCVKVQNDGKIVVVGSVAYNAFSDFLIMRYNSNGTLDLTFGLNGVIINSLSPSDDAANSLAIQSDGKLVVGGKALINGSGQQIALVRYNSNGTIDNSFNSNGIVLVPSGTYLSKMKIQNDGKILITGENRVNANLTELLVMRFNIDGSLDNSFDGDGIVKTIIIPNESNTGNDILVQNNGKIVVAGRAGNIAKIVLVRYNIDGTLDTTFASNGIFLHSAITSANHSKSVSLQSNGKIVIGGNENNGPKFLLERYNMNGSIDTTFGANGVSITNFSPNAGLLQDMEILPDDKIVACGTYISNNSSFLVARYYSDGSLDSTFGQNGWVETHFPNNNDQVSALTIQADSKIVVVGYCYENNKNNIGVARYNNSISTNLQTKINTEIIVSPNPTNKQAKLQFSNNLNNAKLMMYNEIGKMVKQIDNINGNQLLIDAADLKNGIYYIHVSQNDNYYSVCKLVLLN